MNLSYGTCIMAKL